MRRPYWKEGIAAGAFPPIQEELAVDVLVVGAGIAGVTTALLLRRAGFKVALLERGCVGSGETSHTTAHVTYMTDTRLADLVSAFGKERAKLAWEAGKCAMEVIRGHVSEFGLDCELRTVPGYLVAAGDKPMEKERASLARDAQLAREMGFDVELVEHAPPDGRPGIVFRDQLMFHPLKYLHGLARAASREGVAIFEESPVDEFVGKGRAMANGCAIHFGEVAICTHVPLQANATTAGAVLFQSKLAPYSTYAVAARLPANEMPEMIWSDTADPFLYFRVGRDEGGMLAILGGGDHKTGQRSDTELIFDDLERRMTCFSPQAEISHAWSGQVIETVDGLPFIGRNGNRHFIATGFSGNGMTFGTFSGILIRDVLTGSGDSWGNVFSPSRKTFHALPEYLRQNKDYPVRMVTGRIGMSHEDPVRLDPGSGCIMEVSGERSAVYRDLSGEIHMLSPVCPHLGCIVAWNGAEETWDCPCHGSRFTGEGDLISGPAEEGLGKLRASPKAH